MNNNCVCVREMARFYVFADADSKQKHKLNEADRVKIAVWLCEAGHTCTFCVDEIMVPDAKLPIYTMILAYIYSEESILITSYRVRIERGRYDSAETLFAWARPWEDMPVPVAVCAPFCFWQVHIFDDIDMYMPPPPPHSLFVNSVNWRDASANGDVVAEAIQIHPAKGDGCVKRSD